MNLSGLRSVRRLAAAVIALCCLAAQAPAQMTPPTDWPLDPVDWRRSPVDLSFLNAPERPAGKHGFLHARGDVLQFDDGTTARFWGTNLTAAALFGTDREAVRQQARRLSQLGFNLVRLHHHDSYWVDPNIFGAASPTDTRHLDAAMLERIDWWIHCLKQEGIYVWLDLHVQRQLRAGDGIANFDEIAKGKAGVELKGYNYIDTDIREGMKRFNEAYLGHVNAYTRLAYKDEPAIAAVLVTNENDVTHHFAQLLLPDKKVPVRNRLYMAQAKAFAAKHGLPADKVWRSWEDGPSKLFLNDLEHRFNRDMVAHLRHFGVKVPIVTTSLWGGRLLSLPALTDGDMIDVHAYEGSGVLERDPRRAATIVHAIASAHLVGKPLSVTEWNMVGFPALDRQVLPLYIAASARHQGWSALMQYAYAQVPLQFDGKPSNWHAFNDPAMLASLPAAALLFRQGHVREASSTYVLAPTPAQLFDHPLGAGGTVAMRTAAERGRLVTVLPAVKALPWLQPGTAPAGAIRIDDLSTSFIGPDAVDIVSDTGELRRDWSLGLFTIDTPRTQAAVGKLDGRKLTLADVEIDMQGHASVAVQSLDGRAISSSRNLLVSVATPSLPIKANVLPFRTQAPQGAIVIRARRGLVLQRDTGGAEARGAVRVAYKGGRYRLRFDGSTPVHWLHLQATDVAGQ